MTTQRADHFKGPIIASGERPATLLPMAEITNPHDRFFAEVFSRADAAREFVLHYLPPEIVAHFDLDTLTPSKDSFIDPELRRTFSDLLFTVKFRTTRRHGYIYLLFDNSPGQENCTGRKACP